MSNHTDQCKKLRKLHDRLTEEVRKLEEELQLEAVRKGLGRGLKRRNPKRENMV